MAMSMYRVKMCVLEMLLNWRKARECLLIWCCSTRRRIEAYLSEVDGVLYIKTDQLDGETDWKVRETVSLTQKSVQDDPMCLLDYKGYVHANPPSKEIHKFKGSFFGNNDKKEALRLKNTVWSHTVLASSEAYGLVIFVGKETRIKLNSKEPRTKIGKTDCEIDRLSQFLFAMMVTLSCALLFMSGLWNSSKWYIHGIKYVVLLSSIIPISLRVNVDFAKLLYSFRIGYDERLEGTVVRNTGIPEELGRIEYLLSDKTGTMTKNEMVFKRVTTEKGNYSAKNKEIIIEKLKSAGKELSGDKDSSEEGILKMFAQCLMLCHNVTPKKSKNKDGSRAFKSSSPDEVALVMFGEELEYLLEDRDTKSITLKTPTGDQAKYTILENFPFNSERKRMGIIVRHDDSGKILFFLKGADSVIARLVGEKSRSFVKEESDNLAKEGLRTLAMCYKEIDEKEFEDWRKKYEEAGNDLENREKRENEIIELLEDNLTVLGITGVEDLLQDDIKTVIVNLIAAGIRVWMLTGDKLETAKCIAISTGLKSGNQTFLEITDAEDRAKLIQTVKGIEKDRDSVIVVEGDTLQKILKDEEMRKAFIDYSSLASSVVCCRCAPFQKSEIATAIKKQLKKIICCVGDGGNDVAMIQKGDVGIGIEGKEGNQASLASDFSISEFKTLAPLILWTGRLSYIRTSLLANFVIHRGLIIATIQFFYTVMYSYTNIPIYNGYLMLGYATVFTCLPVFSLTFDEDVSYRQVLEYPILYKNIQNGKELSIRTFLGWAWLSIFQGATLLVVSIIVFENSFFELVTITFTSLILIEMLNIATSVRKWHYAIKVSIAMSFIIYGCCLVFLRHFFMLSEITWQFGLKVLLITAAAWIPVKVYDIIKNLVSPTLAKKIRKEEKSKNLLNTLPSSNNTIHGHESTKD